MISFEPDDFHERFLDDGEYSLIIRRAAEVLSKTSKKPCIKLLLEHDAMPVFYMFLIFDENGKASYWMREFLLGVGCDITKRVSFEANELIDTEIIAEIKLSEFEGRKRNDVARILPKQTV